MRQIFRPLNGCTLVASSDHHNKRCGEWIGKVVEVDGGIVFFRNNKGETDSIIWRNNKTINMGI